MASSTTTTTPLIHHDDLENRQHLAGSPAGHRLSLAKFLSGILVSVLVICALVAVIHNQSQQPSLTNHHHGGDKPSSATIFPTATPEVGLKRFPIQLETNAEVEWQRSVYHFQPDKNYISDPDGTPFPQVDHSIVEGFAQGGRTVVTSRVYPTKAIYGAAKLFLFNNATGISVKASVKIWKMKEAQLDPFPLSGWTS